MIPLRRVAPLDLPAVRPARRVGVEQELRLWTADGQLDFRLALPKVAPHLRRLDPGDPRACRLPSGTALTADGLEAELATAPYPAQQDVASRLDAVLASERARLRSAVEPLSVERITGYSTHVSVSVDDDAVVDVGRAFVRACGIALTLLAEPASSMGVFVRPRRGRLELGTEYAEGRDLERIIVFAIGAVATLEHGRPAPDVPAPVVEASREKFGWHLPVSGATATCLHAGDRDVLNRVWEWVRPDVVRLELDPAPVDELVAGAPLRTETHLDASLCTYGDPGAPALAGHDTGPRRTAAGVDAETAWLTWEHVAWELRRGRRRLFAVMQVDQEREFLRRLDAGDLDRTVARELGRRLGRQGSLRCRPAGHRPVVAHPASRRSGPRGASGRRAVGQSSARPLAWRKCAPASR